MTDWSRIKAATAVVALVFCWESQASAAPILAEVTSCTDLTCIVEPLTGPVDVDPTSFTLDVELREILRYIDLDDRGLMRLTFEYTGEHDGTELFGNITFLDPIGNPIPALTLIGQFDDSNPVAGILTVSFDTVGSEALLSGFQLALSDGSGVDTLQWTRATIFPTELVPVPEPSVLLLWGAGVGIAMKRRRWRKA
jgi:hypothetical protein